MPRSRSWSIVSITRSDTLVCSANTPDWRSMASTSVVLPWSTWAMMAMFLRSVRIATARDSRGHTASTSCAARSPRRDRHRLQAQPVRHHVQLGGQLRRGLLGRVSLSVGRLHAQHARLAVGLQVHARHQPVAEQERQHVVAVHALGRGHVDLEPVAEAEQVLRARSARTRASRTATAARGARTRRGRARRGAGTPRRSSPRPPPGSARPPPRAPRSRAAPRAGAGGSSRAGTARWPRRARARRCGSARAARRPDRGPARSRSPAAARARAGRSGARTAGSARRRSPGPTRTGTPARAWCADQFQPHSSLLVAGTSCCSSSSSRAAVSGPRLRPPPRARPHHDPGARARAAACRPRRRSSALSMRQRSSRCVAGGMNDASCAQYSTRRRGSRPAARSSSAMS